MTEKKFTVHIKWFNYEKTEGEIELFDNGQPLLVSECIEDVQWIKSLLNELYEENKELQEFKDKVFNLIDKTIESETQIAENIESTIEGDYVKAVNRLTIIAFKNLKKELSK